MSHPLNSSALDSLLPHHSSKGTVAANKPSGIISYVHGARAVRVANLSVYHHHARRLPRIRPLRDFGFDRILIDHPNAIVVHGSIIHSPTRPHAGPSTGRRPCHERYVKLTLRIHQWKAVDTTCFDDIDMKIRFHVECVREGFS